MSEKKFVPLDRVHQEFGEFSKEFCKDMDPIIVHLFHDFLNLIPGMMLDEEEYYVKQKDVLKYIREDKNKFNDEGVQIVLENLRNNVLNLQKGELR